MRYRVKTDLLAGVSKGDEYESSEHSDFFYSTNSTRLPKDVIDRNPNWFEEVKDEFEIDDWIYYESGSVVRKRSEHYAEGYDAKQDSWEESWKIDGIEKPKRRATREEVEEALIEEAKRRGYKEGVDVKHPNPDEYDSGYPPIHEGEFEYRHKHDWLALGGRTIYSKGSWAEIIDQTPDIEVNGYKAEFHDEYVKFGCAKINRGLIIDILRTCESHNKNNEALDNDCKKVQAVQIGKGNFTIEQLKQIREQL